MNKLTEEEINLYIKQRDNDCEIDGITREYLECIDLDKVPEVEKRYDRIFNKDGEQLYKLDYFTPRPNSYAFKPSFAGRQVLLGKEGRKLYFSNGRWFSSLL